VIARVGEETAEGCGGFFAKAIACGHLPDWAEPVW
jgi:hypothetical protein